MPQLNPEFYISQLFWLVVCFTFLFIFLWRISLPRISSVLEKRTNKRIDDTENVYHPEPFRQRNKFSFHFEGCWFDEMTLL